MPLLRRVPRPDVESVLLRVPLFSDLRKPALRRIARLAEAREYAPGELIIREGEPANAFYILVAGRAQVLRGKRSAPVTTLRVGDFFGEMALLDSFPRSASVRATVPNRCLVLARWDFLKELRLHREIALQMLPILSRRIRELETTLLP